MIAIIVKSNKNLPANNLVVLLHLEDIKKIKHLIDTKIKEENFNVNDPINKVDICMILFFGLIICTKMGDTALHYAAYKKNKEIIKYLLLQGANPSLKNSVISLFLLFIVVLSFNICIPTIERLNTS